MTAETFFLFRLFKFHLLSLFFLKFAVGCGIEVKSQVWGYFSKRCLKFSPLFFLRHLQVHRLQFLDLKQWFWPPSWSRSLGWHYSPVSILYSGPSYESSYSSFPAPLYEPGCEIPLRVMQFETPKTRENTVLWFILTLMVVDAGEAEQFEWDCLGQKHAESKSLAGAPQHRGPQEPRAYLCAAPGPA